MDSCFSRELRGPDYWRRVMSSPKDDDDSAKKAPPKGKVDEADKQAKPEDKGKEGISPLSPEDVNLIGGRGISTQPVTGPPITVTGNPPPPPPVTGPPITVTGNPPPPPPPPPNPNCATPLPGINTGFVNQNEGGVRTDGYVPKDASGAPAAGSGVTIGAGVDLQFRTAASLQQIGVSQDIINAVSPYFGLSGSAAQNALDQTPLNLTSTQAAELTITVQDAVQANLTGAYNNATPFANFDNLPPNTQTAIFDLAYQYGDGSNLAARTPNFWNQITTGDWQGAVNNLNNFGDGNPTRRQAEAALMQNDLNQYTMPSAANPC